MTLHQTIPFPELTGDAARDIKALHEYVFKLQEALIYTLELYERKIKSLENGE